jgi:secreted trypsin-like serine protease
MPDRSLDDFDQARVREAIRKAEEQAGSDDAAFLAALNAHYFGAVGAAAAATTRALGTVTTGAGGRRALRMAGAPTRSFQILKDAEYLGNARELARGGLAGAKVVGGVAVKSADFSDCVAVGNDERWACTGTLISRKAVLTAGHCAAYATRVFFGNDVGGDGREVAVARRVRHPRYHKGERNDLTVLILEERVDDVDPRRLAAGKVIDKAKDGRIVGFGTTDTGGRFGYGAKRMVDVPIVSAACRRSTPERDDWATFGCDRGLELVAGRPLLERDSCKGDSGGPIYVQASGGEWLLAGATSRAVDSATHTCGDGGIYVRVDKYRRWIAGIRGVGLA